MAAVPTDVADKRLPKGDSDERCSLVDERRFGSKSSSLGQGARSTETCTGGDGNKAIISSMEWSLLTGGLA